jgi:hypothetical protein
MLIASIIILFLISLPRRHSLPRRLDLSPSLASSPEKKKKKKKKKHKKAEDPIDPAANEEPTANPTNISISDAETESGNEHDNDNDKNDPPDEEEEEAPDKRSKNKRYDKEDFIARRHDKEREPWVQKSMPFPGKSFKTKEEEHYNKFCEWMKPLFLQIPLTDAIKLPPYSKYMKDKLVDNIVVPEVSNLGHDQARDRDALLRWDAVESG